MLVTVRPLRSHVMTSGGPDRAGTAAVTIAMGPQSRRVQQPGPHRLSRRPAVSPCPSASLETVGCFAPVNLPYRRPFVAAMAWSTVSWMPKTFVSPVIRKIFRIRSRVQTRSSEPS